MRRGAPKKLKFAPSYRDWVKQDEELKSDEILVIDYYAADAIANGMLPKYDSANFRNFILDENELWKPEAEERGVCHVVVDSLTGMQYSLLDYVVCLRGPTKSGWMGTDEDVYGKAIEKMKEAIDSLVSLKFDFILTAHVEIEKDAVSGKVLEQPLIYGRKLPGLILSKMDDIYYAYSDFSTGKLDYFWGTQPQMLLKIIGQRSFDSLPVRVEPNFQKLYGDRLFSKGKPNGVNVILIGESKSGKTVSLETLPRGTVLFSFDKGGWKSLQRGGT